MYIYSAEGHKRGLVKSKKDKKSTRRKGGREKQVGPNDSPNLQIFD